LVLAADQFIIRPNTRLADSARAHASGDHARTVIAGYHWFTDWGRDTMISLEGLTLTTGRFAEAGFLLRTFARYVKDGLIPNHFPEGSTEAVYHTADASLWYFHALARYLTATDDRQTLQVVLPALQEIADRHLQGTRFGIRVDPSDGLLAQGEQGYQLTWMDAKVDDWVVTPRRGKAVEINALWHNALCLLAKWQLAAGNASIASTLAVHAERAQVAFNRRFWNSARDCLFDVVDGEHGDDAALRPNQILAISLDYPILNATKWPAVVERVSTELLTPFGLRTLSRDHPDYKPTYDGDLRARDAAYHQGTVWPWLLGHFVDAWLRVYPDRVDQAKTLLKPLEEHLGEAGVGSISEIFDAEPPYYPRGCTSQAWSVAEALRAWVKCHGANVAQPMTQGAAV
jgi:predicted glycogen debranching enzyme